MVLLALSKISYIDRYEQTTSSVVLSREEEVNTVTPWESSAAFKNFLYKLEYRGEFDKHFLSCRLMTRIFLCIEF